MTTTTKYHRVDCQTLINPPADGEPAVQCPACRSWLMTRDGEVCIVPGHMADEIAKARWTPSSYAHAIEVRVTYYRGSAHVSQPISDPADPMFGGWREGQVQCEHMHETMAAAEACMRAIARAEARRRNAEEGR